MMFFLWCVRKQSYLCSENKRIIKTNGYQTGSELIKRKKIMVTLMIVLAVVAASISLAVNVNDKISMGL